MINCISSVTLKTFSFCNHKKETLYHLLLNNCPLSNKFWNAFELHIFQSGNKSTDKSQPTKCYSWGDFLNVSHIKLFDNDRQIVSVGLQNEWYSSQCNMLSSESEHENTNRKVH